MTCDVQMLISVGFAMADGLDYACCYLSDTTSLSLDLSRTYMRYIVYQCCVHMFMRGSCVCVYSVECDFDSIRSC